MYIKVDGDLITFAGMVADEYMLEEGYFEYKGDIPVCGKDQSIVWDNKTKTMILRSSLTEEIVRSRRGEMLKECDSISPLRYNSFTKEKQLEWVKYRQDLLDISEQSGFPTEIIWPETPTK